MKDIDKFYQEWLDELLEPELEKYLVRKDW